MRTNGWSLVIAAFLGGLLGARLPEMIPSVHAIEGFVKKIMGNLFVSALGHRGTVGIEKLEGEGSGLFFFAPSGRARLQASVFPDGRLSCFGLMAKDSDINPKFFMRMDGSNPSPMVFFKNSRDQHRIDMGLDINNPDQEPYLVYFDRQGKKQAVFGNFPYIENSGGKS